MIEVVGVLISIPLPASRAATRASSRCRRTPVFDPRELFAEVLTRHPIDSQNQDRADACSARRQSDLTLRPGSCIRDSRRRLLRSGSCTRQTPGNEEPDPRLWHLGQVTFGSCWPPFLVSARLASIVQAAHLLGAVGESPAAFVGVFVVAETAKLRVPKPTVGEDTVVGNDHNGSNR